LTPLLVSVLLVEAANPAHSQKRVAGVSDLLVEMAQWACHFLSYYIIYRKTTHSPSILIIRHPY